MKIIPYSNRSTDLGKHTDQGPSCHGGYPINVFPGGAIVTSKGPCPSVPPSPTPSGCVPLHGRPEDGRHIEMGGATPGAKDSCRRLEFGLRLHLRPPTYRYPERDGEREDMD